MCISATRRELNPPLVPGQRKQQRRTFPCGLLHFEMRWQSSWVSKHRAILQPVIESTQTQPLHFAGRGGREKLNVPTWTWLGLSPNPLPANQQVQL